MSVGIAGQKHTQGGALLGPRAVFVAAVAAIAVLTLAVARTLHWDYVAPLMATGAFVFAAAVAVAGWRQRKALTAQHVTYWDVAGVLTLIGLGAAAMVDSEQMMRLLGAEL